MQYHLSLILCVVVMAIGCGKRIPDRPGGLPETVPCTLTVTFGGEKIDGVRILLRPKDKTTKWMSGGITDADGKARIKTGGYYDGAAPGDYVVSFQKTGRVELDEKGMPARSHSLIPDKYVAGKSTETITITKSQTEYTFALDGTSPSE